MHVHRYEEAWFVRCCTYASVIEILRRESIDPMSVSKEIKYTKEDSMCCGTMGDVYIDPLNRSRSFLSRSAFALLCHVLVNSSHLDISIYYSSIITKGFHDMFSQYRITRKIMDLYHCQALPLFKRGS